MFKVKNLVNNENVRVLEKKGNMRILEYINDLSVTPYSAINSYFAHKITAQTQAENKSLYAAENVFQKIIRKNFIYSYFRHNYLL